MVTEKFLQMFQQGFSPFFHSKNASSMGVFFALQGAKVDGHQYLKDVASQGCQYAIVSNTYTGPSYGMNLHRVVDPLLFLQELAGIYLESHSGIIVGITGSVGKTTTKEIVAQFLETKYRVYKTEGNSNSQVSFPIAALAAPRNAEVLVMEMGMSLPGEITKLIQIAPPDYVLITCIGTSHYEFFDSVEKIAFAKAEILQSSKTKKAFLGPNLAGFPEALAVGTCEKIFPKIKVCLPENIPAHFELNVGLAMAIAKELGIEESECEKKMKTLEWEKRRFQKHWVEDVLWIDDSYNAAPLSVIGALKSLPKVQGRKIAVLGSMMELGNISEKSHVEVGIYAKEILDELILIGKETLPLEEEFKKSGKPVFRFNTNEEIREYLEKHLRAYDLVLLKASKSLSLWEIAPWESLQSSGSFTY